MANNSLPISLKDEALRLVRQGMGIAKIEQALGLADRALIMIRENDPAFDAEFRRARKNGTEYIEDSLLTAHEDIPDIMKARLYSENARSVLKYRNPEVYGDKIQVDHRGQIDLAAALSQGLERVQRLHSDSAANIIDVTPVESNTYELEPCDTQSQNSTIDDLLA